ncbi:MAG: lysyl oxidase family protein [Solirubrobacterales bacterium]
MAGNKGISRGRTAGLVMALTALLMTGLLASLLGGSAERAGAERGGYSERAAFGKMVGPCADQELRQELRCPDLKMRKPYDLNFTRSPGGRLLLEAANDIQSRGAGPLEVRGVRASSDRMRAHQVIYRKGGGKLRRKPSASLVFFPVPYQGSYWRFANAARFEIWSLNNEGELGERVRVGPKANYCLRDLQRTMPSDKSPSYPVYPACNQSASTMKVTLGISVGWSDVYPSGYYQNYVSVDGLRGCYLLREIADPLNRLSELSEDNNVGKRRIRLTGSGGSIRSC